MTEAKVKLVEKYFSYLNALQDGESTALDGMLGMWVDDGICTFIGTPPTGSFKGEFAIRVLYTSILRRPIEQVRSVKCTLSDVSSRGDKVVAVWTLHTETVEGKKFSISGTSAFEFKDNKISSLEIASTPKPFDISGFTLDELKIADIGRLSLAAWAVV